MSDSRGLQWTISDSGNTASVKLSAVRYFSMGRFSFIQAAKPPCKVRTSEKSFFFRIPAAFAERLPIRHTTTIGRDLNFDNVFISVAIRLSGMFLAFGIWPF